MENIFTKEVVRTLIVDDSPIDAQLMQGMLANNESFVFNTVIVHSFSQASEHLRSNKLDLVILDLGLPDSQGIDTLIRLRRENLEVATVVITGLDNEDMGLAAIQQDAQDYLVKGTFDKSNLVRSIRYSLERKRVSETLRKTNEKLIVNEKKLMNTLADLSMAHQELKDAQTQLIQAEKLQSVGILAAGVAHEVKNPLAIILQGVEYLLKKVHADDANIRMVLENLDNAVHRADNIIRELLDVTSLTKIEFKLVNLNDIIDKICVLMQQQFEKFKVNVVKQLQEQIPLIKIDPDRIEQVFVNLMLNAVYAMVQGGQLVIKTYTVTFSDFDREKGVGRRKEDPFKIGETVIFCEIEDTGTGIPPEVLSKIFDPFFTTRRHMGGTGLGLSVVRSIMQVHNGRIDIKNNEQGPGVQVTLIFKVE